MALQMHTDPDILFIDSLLDDWKEVLGKDYAGYRNHVVRVAGFCFQLHPCDAIAKRKILIAACYHDIGIWAERTFDYIDPSVREALAYLHRHDLDAWSDEIRKMISEHHKLKRLAGGRDVLAEIFRRGDWVDLSLGLIKFGLPGPVLKSMRARYPNSGFHRTLFAKAASWFRKRPWNPFPMVKW